MELDTALRNRRSIRKFKKQEVSLEKVKMVVKAGTLAPSACNKQPWEFLIINDQSLIEEIVEKAGAQRQIKTAPCLIVVLYEKDSENIFHENVQSVSAAVQNMLLKAHEIGLGACWIVGFGDVRILSKLLNIPRHLAILCLITIGNPDEAPFPPPKKDINDILHINKYVSKKDQLPRSIRPSKWTTGELSEYQRFRSRAKYLGKDYEVYGRDEVEKIKEIIDANLEEGGIVLNLMGYDGTMLRKIMPVLSKASVIDCELNEDVIKFVKFKTEKPKFIVINDKIGLDDGSVDLVLSCFSLEKLPSYKAILMESERVLKPRGKLIIFLKNKTSFYGLLYFGMEKLLGLRNLDDFMHPGPFQPIPLFQLKRNLKKLGLKEKTNTLCFLPGEIVVYKQRIDGYLKRHKQGISFLSYFVKPAVYLTYVLYNLTGWIKFPPISSSVCIIAQKRDS